MDNNGNGGGDVCVPTAVPWWGYVVILAIGIFYYKCASLYLRLFFEKRVKIEPKELKFPEAGGNLKVKLTNCTGERQAVLVTCSDDVLYRVNPVFAFIDNGASTEIEVIRQTGNPKADKILIYHTPANDDGDTNAASLFKKDTAYPTIFLNIE